MYGTTTSAVSARGAPPTLMPCLLQQETFPARISPTKGRNTSIRNRTFPGRWRESSRSKAMCVNNNDNNNNDADKSGMSKTEKEEEEGRQSNRAVGDVPGTLQRPDMRHICA